jgi:hypothetical protein
MSPETAVRETLPALNVAVERFLKSYEKRRFLRKLRTAKKVLFEDGWSSSSLGISTPFTVFGK